uniref:Uncharacterized protein n=1 Tax=Arundo donax TaxID=35708 RepID=A0A0A8YH54_ARUDO
MFSVLISTADWQSLFYLKFSLSRFSSPIEIALIVCSCICLLSSVCFGTSVHEPFM